jgi:hypothetical protein
MKSKINILITILVFVTGRFIYAGIATWSTNPVTSDWNTATNWSPPTVPNGPADTATFSATSKATVLISNTGIEVASAIFDSAASLDNTGEGCAYTDGCALSLFKPDRGQFDPAIFD